MSKPAARGSREAGRGSRGQGGGLPITQPRLTHLLVLTAVALAALLCVRLPSTLQTVVTGDRLVTLRDFTGVFRGGGDGPVTSPAGVIEPAAGPTEPTAASAAVGHATPDPMTVTAVQELAAELARREKRLERREQSLAAQEAALTLVEQRIRQQSTDLDALRTSTAALIDQVTAEDEARAAQLSRMYEAMKPRNAAAILEQLDLDLVLPIVRGMRDGKVSAIVAAMSPDHARAITTELARRRTAELPR